MALSSMLAGGLGFMGAQQAAGAAEKASFIAQQNADRGVNEAALARHYARNDTAPWRTAGAGAVEELSRLMGLGGFRQDADPTYEGWTWPTLDQSNRAGDQKAAQDRFLVSPDYQFRTEEGLKALERSAASRTGVLSGAQTKATQRFGQELGKGEYGDYTSRLFSLAGLGNQAASTAAGADVAVASPMVSALTGGAATASSDLVAAGQARQSGFNALASGVIRADNNAQKWASRIWGFGG